MLYSLRLGKICSPKPSRKVYYMKGGFEKVKAPDGIISGAPMTLYFFTLIIAQGFLHVNSTVKENF